MEVDPTQVQISYVGESYINLRKTSLPLVIVLDDQGAAAG